MPDENELISKLRSDDVDIIKDALEQLGDLGDDKVVPQLLKMIDTAEDDDLLESILWTLSRIASTSTLIELLNNPNKLIVVEVLDALGRRVAHDAVDEIIPFTEHHNGEIRAIATWALGKINAQKTYALLLNLLQTDADPLVRANAAWAIGKFENIQSLHVLNQIKENERDESVLYNLNEAIHHVQEASHSRQTGLKAQVYECSKRSIECTTKTTQIESHADNLIKIEIVVCNTCSIARICHVDLTWKITRGI